jgi:hypothetical protein
MRNTNTTAIMLNTGVTAKTITANAGTPSPQTKKTTDKIGVKDKTKESFDNPMSRFLRCQTAKNHHIGGNTIIPIRAVPIITASGYAEAKFPPWVIYNAPLNRPGAKQRVRLSAGLGRHG